MQPNYHDIIKSIQKNYINFIMSFNIDSISSDNKQVDDELNNFRNQWLSFWEDNAESLINAIKKINLVSIGIWGEMGITEITPKYLLYFDTVFIPDPLPTYTNNWHNLTVENKKNTIEPYIQIVNYLDKFIKMDAPYTLIIFYPQYYKGIVIDEQKDKIAQTRASELTFISLSKIFNFKENVDSANKFYDLSSLHGMQMVNARLDEHKLHRLINYLFISKAHLHQLHASGLTEPLIEELEKRILRKSIKHTDLPRIGSTIDSLYYLSFMRSFDAKLYGFHPATSEDSWSFHTVKNEILESLLRDANCISPEEIVVNSFQTNFEWLNNITIEDCIRLRNNERLEEIRELFKKATVQFSNAGIVNYKIAGDTYENNITNILKEYYSKTEEEIRKHKGNIYKSSAYFGATALLGVASLSSPVASVVSMLVSVSFGGKSIVDIVKEVKGLKNVKVERTHNPLTFLYSQYNENLK